MPFRSKRHLHSSDLENRTVFLMCGTLITGHHKPTADKPAANLSFTEGRFEERLPPPLPRPVGFQGHQDYHSGGGAEEGLP